MTNLKRTLSVAFLVANMVVAALWVTVLHPGSQTIIGKAASSSMDSPIVTAPSSSAFFVGNELPPPEAGCVFSPSSEAVKGPSGQPAAHLTRIPSDFSESIGATFPPCGSLRRAPEALVQAALTAPGVRILSVVQYTGTSGSLLIATLRPNAAALRKGLYLGNTSGSLPDGTPTFSLQGGNTNGEPQMNALRWYQNGLIIDVMGSNLSIERLRTLAATVAQN
jgi:hypothetical protein